MLSSIFKSKKRRKLEKEGLASSKKRLKQENTIGHAMNKSRIISLILLTLVWAFCSLVLIIPTDIKNPEFYLVEGQLAPKTIHSDFNFVFCLFQFPPSRRAFLLLMVFLKNVLYK